MNLRKVDREDVRWEGGVEPWHSVTEMHLLLVADLNSNDSYGTVVNLGLDQDGSSPHSAGSRAPHFTLHGGPATPPYLSSSHSPTPPHPALGPNFPYSTGEGLAVYTTLGKYHFWFSKYGVSRRNTAVCVMLRVTTIVVSPIPYTRNVIFL
jgi:hypothetical protein